MQDPFCCGATPACDSGVSQSDESELKKLKRARQYCKRVSHSAGVSSVDPNSREKDAHMMK